MPARPTPEQIAHWSESKQGSITAALIVILLLGNLSVAVRFLSQFRTHRRLLAEDYLIAFAVVRFNEHRCWLTTLTTVQICFDVVIALLFVGKFHQWLHEANEKLVCLKLIQPGKSMF